MAGILERTLRIIELLAKQAEGLSLAAIADRLDIPRSATHRLLKELERNGYVRQVRDQGDYVLTTKLTSLGLGYLSASGIVDAAQPLIDGLAEHTGELVRLSVIDGRRLTWVAKAQGARSGLRYDPDMGAIAQLSCSSSGMAWLSTLTDEQALELVAEQGFGQPEEFGPNAPATAIAVTKYVQTTRERGFSVTSQTYAPGMAAMAAPVCRRANAAIGTISVAGPHVRLTEEKMLHFGNEVMAVAAELAASSSASALLRGGRGALRSP